MENKYGWIYDQASKHLNERQFSKWLNCVYGVLESNITEAQASILVRLLRQDIKAQASDTNQ